MLKLPPPIWALIYLGLAGAVSWGLGWPPIGWPPHHMTVGTVIFFSAWVLPVWAFRTFTTSGTEVDPMSETNRALVTHGPYRFTRNPMYLGLVIAALGMAILVGTWPMLAAPVAVFLTVSFVHIPFEEAKMRRQFAEAYDAYASKVRRWV